VAKAHGYVFDGPILYQGMLTKKGGGSSVLFSRRNWKDRHVVLTEMELVYFESEQAVAANDPLHSIPSSEFIRVATHPRKENSWELHTSHRIFYFTAPNPVQWQEWMTQVKGVLERKKSVVELEKEQNYILDEDIDDYDEEGDILAEETRFMEALRRNSSQSKDKNDKGVSPIDMIQRKLRAMVSLKKRRFVDHNFDLDLTYILPNVIAMGFPAEGKEATYRNPLAEVQRFFEYYHPNHFLIINLCSERAYDRSLFGGMVERYPFDDHNCPRLEVISECCGRMANFLSKDEKNVVAIHCKAGKGRTGMMVSCFLLYLERCQTPSDALGLFARRRTLDGKGVTIPSQMRYVDYFHEQLKWGVPTNPGRRLLSRLRMSAECSESHPQDALIRAAPFLRIYVTKACGKVLVAGSAVSAMRVVPSAERLYVDFDMSGEPVEGDIRVDVRFVDDKEKGSAKGEKEREKDGAPHSVDRMHAELWEFSAKAHDPTDIFSSEIYPSVLSLLPGESFGHFWVNTELEGLQVGIPAKFCDDLEKRLRKASKGKKVKDSSTMPIVDDSMRLTLFLGKTTSWSAMES